MDTLLQILRSGNLTCQYNTGKSPGEKNGRIEIDAHSSGKEEFTWCDFGYTDNGAISVFASNARKMFFDNDIRLI